MYWSSMAPLAWTANSVGISTTMSGLMFHPSVKAAGEGRSFPSPSTAPPSTHAASVSLGLGETRRVAE